MSQNWNHGPLVQNNTYKYILIPMFIWLIGAKFKNPKTWIQTHAITLKLQNKKKD